MRIYEIPKNTAPLLKQMQHLANWHRFYCRKDWESPVKKVQFCKVRSEYGEQDLYIFHLESGLIEHVFSSDSGHSSGGKLRPYEKLSSMVTLWKGDIRRD